MPFHDVLPEEGDSERPLGGRPINRSAIDKADSPHWWLLPDPADERMLPGGEIASNCSRDWWRDGWERPSAAPDAEQAAARKRRLEVVVAYLRHNPNGQMLADALYELVTRQTDLEYELERVRTDGAGPTR